MIEVHHSLAKRGCPFNSGGKHVC